MPYLIFKVHQDISGLCVQHATCTGYLGHPLREIENEQTSA